MKIKKVKDLAKNDKYWETIYNYMLENDYDRVDIVTGSSWDSKKIDKKGFLKQRLALQYNPYVKNNELLNGE